jgi:hypothetical protein
MPVRARRVPERIRAYSRAGCDTEAIQCGVAVATTRGHSCAPSAIFCSQRSRRRPCSHCRIEGSRLTFSSTFVEFGPVLRLATTRVFNCGTASVERLRVHAMVLAARPADSAIARSSICGCEAMILIAAASRSRSAVRYAPYSRRSVAARGRLLLTSSAHSRSKALPAPYSTVFAEHDDGI